MKSKFGVSENGTDVWTISVIVVFVITIALALALYYVNSYLCAPSNVIHVEECSKHSSTENPENPADENVSKSIGASIDLFMIRIFTKIATFAALSPWVTLIAMLSIAGVLCGGITQLRLTTDPIELWAAPNSRSRIERTFFDETFRPFYRTEQVIVKAKGSNFTYTDLFGRNVTFGPVFQKEFMLKLLDLQKEIEALETPSGLKLVDVSFFKKF